MKSLSLFKITFKTFVAIIILQFITSCSTHSYFTTEGYVKSEIQNHGSFELSDIILKKFYKGTTVSSKGEQISGSIVEIIGVNYKGEKQLAFGIKKTIDNEELFFRLSVEDVQKIMQWMKDVESKIQAYRSSTDYSETKLYEIDYQISSKLYLGVQVPDLSKTIILYFWVDNYRVHKMVLVAFRDILSSFLIEF